jgi:hypothetical protein
MSRYPTDSSISLYIRKSGYGTGFESQSAYLPYSHIVANFFSRFIPLIYTSSCFQPETVSVARTGTESRKALVIIQRDREGDTRHYRRPLRPPIGSWPLNSVERQCRVYSTARTPSSKASARSPRAAWRMALLHQGRIRSITS